MAEDLVDMIKVYKDRDGLEPLEYDSEDGRPLLVMDKIIDVGEEEVVDLYIINRSPHEFIVGHVESAVDAKTKEKDDDVTLEIESTMLAPNEPVKLTMIFSPKKNRRKALNASFGLKGRFIIRY